MNVAGIIWKYTSVCARYEYATRDAVPTPDGLVSRWASIENDHVCNRYHACAEEIRTIGDEQVRRAQTEYRRVYACTKGDQHEALRAAIREALR